MAEHGFDPHPTLRDCIDRWHARHPDAMLRFEMVPAGQAMVRRSPEESRWAAAATRIGIPFDVYRERILAGMRWCSWHRAFQPAAEFPVTFSTSHCTEATRLYKRRWQERWKAAVAP